MTASRMRTGVIWTMFVAVSVVSWLGGCAAEKVPPAAGVTAGEQSDRPSSPDYPDTSECDGLAVEKIEENYPDGSLGRTREVVKLDDGTYISHGVTTLFLEEGGGKKAELSFVCGVRHGESRTWYPGGEVRGEGRYINGKGHGEWKTWYRNGALQQQFTLDHGAWRGPFTQWYVTDFPLRLVMVRAFRVSMIFSGC